MQRRRVLQFGLGGIAGLGAVTLPLTGARKAMAATDPETTVYVSNAGSKDIYVLAMNRATRRARSDRKDPGARHRQAIAVEPADGDQPG